MKICYIDESGDGQRPDPQTADATPVFVICGIVVDGSNVPRLTHEFIRTKKRFRLAGAGWRLPDGILAEVKGGDLRRSIRKGHRESQMLRFLDAVLDLLDGCDAGLLGRVLVKDPMRGSSEDAIYTFSVQNIARHFQHHLTGSGSAGLLICDSRSSSQNVGVAHGVFTQKFQKAGDALPDIVEVPLFCHSDNHAGIQLADIIASALLFPIACRTYCQGYDDTVYTHPAFDLLKERYGSRLMALQQRLRYRQPDGKWVGGLMVRDAVYDRSGGRMFR